MRFQAALAAPGGRLGRAGGSWDSLGRTLGTLGRRLQKGCPHADREDLIGAPKGPRFVDAPILRSSIFECA